MADKNANSKVVYLNVKTRDGTERLLTCSPSAAQLLQSPTTDPAVKQDIMDALMNENEKKVRQQTATGDNSLELHGRGHSTLTGDDSQQKHVGGNSTPSTIPFHIWTEKEEDALVNLRHDIHDDFGKCRNHSQLWTKIANELAKIGCNVTPQQALNKYSALKKKYKEILDAPSGSASKYFRHLENFSTIYGTKASTKPAAVMDTCKEQQLSVLDSQEKNFEDEKTDCHEEKNVKSNGKKKVIFSFDSLPDELLGFIFMFLALQDVAVTIAKVCTRWKNVVKSCWFLKLYRYADISNINNGIDFSVMLTQMTKLVSLKLNVCYIDISNCHLEKHYFLKSLCLIGHGQNARSVFRFLQPVLKNLIHFEIIGVHFTKEELIALSERLKNVRTFIIKYGEALGPNDFRYMISNMYRVHTIDIDITGCRQEWAAVVNERCGRIRFSHNMMDRIPNALLQFCRWKYHLCNVLQ